MIIAESKLIEIYTKNKDSFSVGKVYCQNDEQVVFEDIDTQGKIIGYYAMKKNYISKLKYETEYLKKIYLYMQYAKEHDYSGWFSLEKIKLDIDKSLFDQVINIAKKNNSIITVGRIRIIFLYCACVLLTGCGKINDVKTDSVNNYSYKIEDLVTFPVNDSNSYVDVLEDMIVYNDSRQRIVLTNNIGKSEKELFDVDSNKSICS